MTVKIKVGEQIHVINWTNSIRIEANYMHGDLNGSTTETTMYQRDQFDEISFDLEGLAFLRGLQVQEIEEVKLLVDEFYMSNNNFDHPPEDVEGFIEQYVIQDNHDDSYENAAKLMTVDVYLFDEHGAKFRMNALVNGKPLND